MYLIVSLPFNCLSGGYHCLRVPSLLRHLKGLVFVYKQQLCADMYAAIPVHTLARGRHMPGYPRIDIGNDYLMARYDGAILDGQVCCLEACAIPKKTQRSTFGGLCFLYKEPMIGLHCLTGRRKAPLAATMLCQHASRGQNSQRCDCRCDSAVNVC